MKPESSVPNLISIARQYHERGLTVLPVDHDGLVLDECTMSNRAIAESHSCEDLPWEAAHGIAALCGAGDVVCLFFNKQSGEEQLSEALSILHLDADYPWVVQIADGGYHLWLRCPALQLEERFVTRKDDSGEFISLRHRDTQVRLPTAGGTDAYQFVGEHFPTHPPVAVSPTLLLDVLGQQQMNVEPSACNPPSPLSRSEVHQRQIREIMKTLQLLAEPEQVVEVRIPGVAGRKNRTDSGYFNQPEQLAHAVVPAYSEQAMGIYFTLNPVKPDLLARAANRIRKWANTTTADADIIRRHWLPVDIDPIRPSGISSTDSQHQAALDMASRIRDWLTEQGWPTPVVADSGNGAHLLYRIDLLNDPESTLLVQQVLEAIALAWNEDSVTIDTGNFNAARIWKLYGTKVCKGDATQERPHRWSYICEQPDVLTIVPKEKLQALADSVPAIEPVAYSQRVAGNQPFELEAWMAQHNIIGNKRPWKDGWVWRLDDCPFSDDHDDGAYIVQLGNGAIAAGCFHNRCRDKTWHDLRTLVNEMSNGDSSEERSHSGDDVSEGTIMPQTDSSSIIEMLNLDGYQAPPLPPGIAFDADVAQGACPWLDEYIDFSRTWSPRAYDDFHESVALWILSTVAARRVRLDFGGERYTNLYIALAARTSIYAKSTTARIAIATLKAADLLHLLAPDDATPQAFIRALTQETPSNWSELSPELQAQHLQRLQFAAQKGWFFDEFGQKVSAMMREGGFMADFRSLLRKFDDCPEQYEYVSLNRGSDLVDRPYLALLTNLTPADLQPYAKKHATLWHDGFWARFAFVTPPPDLTRPTGHFPIGERIIPNQLHMPLRTWHQRLVIPKVEMVAIRNEDGDTTNKRVVNVSLVQPNSCTLDADVRNAFNTYNDALVDIVCAGRNLDLDGNYARLAEKALRVAMLLASLENQERIEIRHWARAQQIAETWRRNLHYLYGQVSGTLTETKARSHEETILRFLAEKGPRTKREIYKGIRGLDAHQAGILLESLEKAELLVSMPSGKTMRYALAT